MLYKMTRFEHFMNIMAAAAAASAPFSNEYFPVFLAAHILEQDFDY